MSSQSTSYFRISVKERRQREHTGAAVYASAAHPLSPPLLNGRGVYVVLKRAQITRLHVWAALRRALCHGSMNPVLLICPLISRA